MICNLKSKIENLKYEGSTECVGASGQSHQMTFWILDCEFAIGSSKSKKVFYLALAAMLVALSFSAHAQQSGKVYRVGYLSARLGIDSMAEGFRQGLRDRGYVEGQNLVIEWRFAKGRNDLFPELAAELVRLRLDCILAVGVAAIRAAKQLTDAIPIVMGTIDADPRRTRLCCQSGATGREYHRSHRYCLRYSRKAAGTTQGNCSQGVSHGHLGGSWIQGSRPRSCDRGPSSHKRHRSCCTRLGGAAKVAGGTRTRRIECCIPSRTPGTGRGSHRSGDWFSEQPPTTDRKSRGQRAVARNLLKLGLCPRWRPYELRR